MGKVETKGICGTYSDGLALVKNGGLDSRNRAVHPDKLSRGFGETPRPPSRASSASSTSGSVDDDEADKGTASSPPSTPDASPSLLHIMFLGSSIGNFSRTEAANFIRSLPLRPGSGDTLLLGLDHDNGKELIEEAYNDPKGYTERFIKNGLRVAGRVVGNESLFDEDKWEYVNHYDTVRAYLLTDAPYTNRGHRSNVSDAVPVRTICNIDLQAATRLTSGPSASKSSWTPHLGKNSSS